MWKCTGCGEQIDDEFDGCWKCLQARDGGTLTTEEDLSEGMLETQKENGNLEVTVFGRKLMCSVCQNSEFSRNKTLLQGRGWKPDLNYICTKCGYMFWFATGCFVDLNRKMGTK